MVNLPLLKESIDWAEQHQLAPDEAAPGSMFWDQSMWYTEPHEEYSCGTGVCLAGWISLSHGAKPLVDTQVFKHAAFSCRLTDGTIMRIDAHAQRLLGATPGEAAILFGQENTVPVLREMYRVLEEGRSLEYWYYHEWDGECEPSSASASSES